MAFAVRTLGAVDFDIGYVSGCSEGYENDLLTVDSRERVALGCYTGYFKSLNKGSSLRLRDTLL